MAHEQLSHTKHPTFTTIPIEIRLQIYSLVFHHTLIHLHQRRFVKKFTWTPCRRPRPNQPMLCAHPRWSKLCQDTEKCDPSKELALDCTTVAIMWTCKLIYEETREVILRDAALSIDWEDLPEIIIHLNAKRLYSPRITVTGILDSKRLHRSLFSDMLHYGLQGIIFRPNVLQQYLEGIKVVALQFQLNFRSEEVIMVRTGRFSPDVSAVEWYNSVPYLYVQKRDTYQKYGRRMVKEVVDLDCKQLMKCTMSDSIYPCVDLPRYFPYASATGAMWEED